MSNMNHKWLRILLLIALPAFSVGQAAGQNILKEGFAGEDKDFLMHAGETEYIGRIGSLTEEASSDEYVQYYWTIMRCTEGSSAFFGTQMGIDDPVHRKRATPVLCFHPNEGSGTYVLRCDRVSKYGYQSEYVTINVYNHVEIIAKAKQHCWSRGDEITPDQFDIETVPPGYERFVVMAEDSKEAYSPDFLWYGEEEQEVHFEMGVGYEGSGQETIMVFYPWAVDYSRYSNKTIVNALEVWKRAGQWEDTKRDVEKALKPLHKLGPVSFVYYYDRHFDISAGKECCCGETGAFIDFAGFGGSLFINVSANFYPLGAVPAFVTLGLEGRVGIDIVGLRISDLFNDCSCGSFSIVRAPWSISVTGGIGLAAIDKDFISIGGYITGSLHGALQLKIDGRTFDFQGIEPPNCDIKIKVEAVLIMAKPKFEWTIYD